MRFEDLREKYKEFIYEDFIYSIEDNTLIIEYIFIISDLETFNPKWYIPLNGKEIDINDTNIRSLIFSLGLVELISYWKITCSPNVIIKPSYLDNNQIEWWKKLYFNGLGEFFYTNNINTNIEEFMNIKVSGTNKFEIKKVEYLNGILIPIGGGKDSAVTIDLLKDFYDNNDCYVINERDATKNTAKLANYQDKTINVKRILDKKMIELSGYAKDKTSSVKGSVDEKDLKSKGYLSGHTPFSTIVAFSSLLTSYIYGKKYIALSNESSANEPTVANTTINHQYSKSFEFEKDFSLYVNNYLNIGINYFSILRPVSEFQITSYFSKLTRFHDIFRSCNNGSKLDIWCNNCPKCLFVFIMMSAFLDIEYISKLFGDNILENKNLLPSLYQLIGSTLEKPFECVGSKDEVNIAICTSIQKEKEIPYLYKEYMKTEFYDEYKNKKNIYLKYYDDNNLVPEEFLKIVKDKFDLG